jgi:four helix bundle protein
MQDHRRLHVYQAARDLALEVYAVATALPASERFELARQLRRAAVSVGSNIAEGCGRGTRKDLCAFLAVALGSARELEFQLDLCNRAALAPSDRVDRAMKTTRRVQQMLTRLIVQIRLRARETNDH